MNDNSWGVISAVSAKGNGNKYWSVGDSKEIELKEWGTTITSFNKNMGVYILGFRNYKKEPASDQNYNTITFCLGKKDGRYCCLVDSYYNTYNVNGLYYISRSPRYWEATLYYGRMRHILENNLLDYFPSELKQYLVYFYPTTRTSNSDNFGSSGAKISLPAEYEIFGKNTYGATESGSLGVSQYEFFKNGNSVVRYDASKENWSNYSPFAYWTRTCLNGDDSQFVAVSGNGAVLKMSYNWNLGVTPIFCV